MIGKELGQYHIVEALGEGGMASVYKGYDRRLDRDVAIKVILPGYSHSGSFIKRFEREARSIAKLTHTNIVGVIHYGSDEGIPYLVMEFVSGGSLKELMGKPIHWHQAAQMLAPVARALEYAHEKNIIHRDIKPSNLLVTHSKDLMISDFGIAKALDEDLTKLTATGVGIGTPAYMAPEQGMGKSTDHRADIYSLGIVFYELITGRTPYEADTPFAVIMKHINDPLPRPREFVPDLPDEVEKILFLALAKDPEHRYQDMNEFAQALEGLARQLETKPVSDASPAALPAIEHPVKPVENVGQSTTEEFLTKAEGALARNDWASARIHFREVLNRQPDHAAAQAGLRTVLKEQELARLYGQALLHQEAGDPEQALRSLKQIQTRDASYQDVVEQIQAIEGNLAERQPGALAKTRVVASQQSKPKTPIQRFQKIPRWIWISTGCSVIVIFIVLMGWGISALVFSPKETPDSGTTTSRITATSSPAQPDTNLPESTRHADLINDHFDVPMVLVPAGSFQMGSEVGDQDEKPVHTIMLDDFYIDQYEVTNARYATCVEVGECNPPSSRNSFTREVYYGNNLYADYPVIYVRWGDAVMYCQWREARLPTEAEWEKAARGGLDRKSYPWGSESPNCSIANFGSCVNDTNAIGSYQPNDYGLYDMAGNVREWVTDFYDLTYYHTSPESNPMGPEDGYTRVLRSGSFPYLESGLRVSNRYNASPDTSNGYIGFRCASSVVAP